jgi:phage tail sheath gpL-like
MSINERPGVYTSYEVSSAVSGRSGGGVVGLAASALSGTAGTAAAVTSYPQAAAAFGAGSNMAALVKILLENGASRVAAVPVRTDGGTGTVQEYAAAFETLMGDAAVKFMVCDSQDAAVHAAMKAAIAAGGESCKYRIGVAEADGTATVLVSAAADINSERMVLVGNTSQEGTAGSVAAAAAGCIAAGTDPALPLNGAELYGLGALKRTFSDSDVTVLIQGGVTPIEDAAGTISVVRGVTTRTTTSGAPDATWRELTTILIVDDVIPAVRNSLRARFSRTKNTRQTRGAIRTQVLIELESKLKSEIIDSYGAVTVAADETDPTVCDVSFDFTVAHGLNSVRLTAYITV